MPHKTETRKLYEEAYSILRRASLGVGYYHYMNYVEQEPLSREELAIIITVLSDGVGRGGSHRRAYLSAIRSFYDSRRKDKLAEHNRYARLQPGRIPF